MARALVVDDDPLLRFAVAGMLANAGHEVEVAGSGREGIDFGARWRPEWLVTDWVLQDSLHGLHVAGALRAVRPDLATVLVTGFPPEDLEDAARDLGVSGVLRKPFELDELVATLAASAPALRCRSPGFGVVELDAGGGRVSWANAEGARLYPGCGVPPDLAAPLLAWQEVEGEPGCEVRVREPWLDGRRLVLARPQGGRSDDALADLILGVHDPGRGRWPTPGRVLVVDDQRTVRVMARALLERAGATCYTAGSHDAALRYLSEDSGIGVVLLDFEMPDGDVAALIEPARELRPELVMIGNSGGDNRRGFLERGVPHYVPKPWRLGDLLAVVRRACHGASPAPPCGPVTGSRRR